MATELGSAFISVGLGTSSLAGDIKKAFGSAESSGADAGKSAGKGFTSGFKGLVGAGAALVATGAFAGFIAEAARASDATDKFKATMSFAGLNTKAIDAAKDAAKAYADQTVYDLPTIQNTLAQLASNGVKDYTGLTKAAGNLNAVAGGNADTFKSVAMVMTQTAGAGKLTTENWNQLADAIPGAAGPLMKALEGAGAYTGNFRDAMAKGEITSEEFNAALGKLGNDPVAVEAAKSTKTFEGALGNLEATINSGLMSALDALKPAITGAINLLSGGLGKAFDFAGAVGGAAMKELTGGVRAFGAAFKAADGDVTSKGFAGLMERLGFVASKVQGTAKIIWGGFKMPKDVAASFGANLNPLLAFGQSARTAFDKVSFAAKTLWAGFKMPAEVAASFGANLNPLLAFGQGVRGVVDKVVFTVKTLWAGFKMPAAVAASFGANLNPLLAVGVQVRSTLDVIGASFNTLWSAIGPTLSALVPQVFALFQALSPTSLIFQALLPVLPQIASAVMSVVSAVLPLVLSLTSQLLPVVTQLISAVLPPLISIFGNIVTAIAPLITMVAGLLIPIIQALMPVVVTVFGVIANVITSAMQIVQGIIQVVTGLITGNWSQVWEGIQNVFSGIWNTIVAVVGGAIGIVWSSISAGLGLIGGFVGSVLGNIGRFFSDTWNNVIGGVSRFIGGFIGFFRDLPGKAVAAISGLAGQMLTVGQNIVQGLIDGARGMIDRAVQTVKDIGGSMLKGIQDFLGIHSPSREFMKIGGWVTVGLAEGVRKKAPVAVKAIRDVAQRLTDAATSHWKKAASSKGNAHILEILQATQLDKAAASVRAQVGTLTKLTKQRDALSASLSATQKKLSTAVAARNKQASESANALAGEFKLSDLVGQDAAGIKSYAADTIARLKDFAGKLKSLKGLGLNASLMQQIGAMGSADGGMLADALITGGKGTVSSLNGSFKTIGTVASQAGANIADGMYGAGINGLKGLVSGFSGNLKAVDQAAKKVTDRITSQVKKNLGIHSPSRVFRNEVGQQVGEGARLGILDKVGAVTAAANQLITVPRVPSFTAGNYSPVMAGGAGGGATFNTTINQVDDPIGTSHAVSRRLQSLAI